MRGALATAVAALAAPLLALDVPPTPSRYFTDLAGVVATGEAEGIEARLARFERRTGHQFLIVLFPSLEEYPLE